MASPSPASERTRDPSTNAPPGTSTSSSCSSPPSSGERGTRRPSAGGATKGNEPTSDRVVAGFRGRRSLGASPSAPSADAHVWPVCEVGHHPEALPVQRDVKGPGLSVDRLDPQEPIDGQVRRRLARRCEVLTVDQEPGLERSRRLGRQRVVAFGRERRVPRSARRGSRARSRSRTRGGARAAFAALLPDGPPRTMPASPARDGTANARELTQVVPSKMSTRSRSTRPGTAASVSISTRTLPYVGNGETSQAQRTARALRARPL